VLAFGWRLVFAVFALVLALVTIPLAALSIATRQLSALTSIFETCSRDAAE
jgi:hypothetical protein